MKGFSFSIFNIIALLAIAVLIVLIIIPFNLINLEQAQRIAKWKTVYEELKYSFDMVNLHEGKIVPSIQEAQKVYTEDYVWSILIPYFNLGRDKPADVGKYKYRKLNASPVKKCWQFYFDTFYETKDKVLLSIKQNQTEVISEKQPLYYMFIDINGTQSPNRIGQDIFFISIYKNHITALGEGRTHSRLKANCSPIGSGLFCSEYYLLGGSF